ncbi:MAG: hypothetical protein R3C24_08935 [Cyanobacteriota/Melainabacteria group bacterium]|nr:hypothetical protein [Cyanobacteria bacterium HKST-UBA01]MCB9470367.1 hypothetical protein [Candidatus Obscuribacterales bacterium]
MMHPVGSTMTSTIKGTGNHSDRGANEGACDQMVRSILITQVTGDHFGSTNGSLD